MVKLKGRALGLGWRRWPAYTELGWWPAFGVGRAMACFMTWLLSVLKPLYAQQYCWGHYIPVPLRQVSLSPSGWPDLLKSSVHTKRHHRTQRPSSRYMASGVPEEQCKCQTYGKGS